MTIGDPRDMEAPGVQRSHGGALTWQLAQAYREQQQIRPTTADEAVRAMKERADVLRRELSEVDGKRAELARLERMIAAADGAT